MVQDIVFTCDWGLEDDQIKKKLIIISLINAENKLTAKAFF